MLCAPAVVRGGVTAGLKTKEADALERKAASVCASVVPSVPLLTGIVRRWLLFGDAGVTGRRKNCFLVCEALPMRSRSSGLRE